MRVLVVEDQQKTASFIRKALEGERFAVDVCANGEDALAAALLVALAGALDPGSVIWSPWPLAWPVVTPVALAATMVGLVPVLVSSAGTTTAARPARQPVAA